MNYLESLILIFFFFFGILLGAKFGWSNEMVFGLGLLLMFVSALTLYVLTEMGVLKE